jgi:hypothetical protein
MCETVYGIYGKNPFMVGCPPHGVVVAVVVARQDIPKHLRTLKQAKSR